MQNLSLEEKIGQMIMVGFQGLEAPDYILDWLAQGRIGGVILFSRNVQNPTQLAALTQSIHAAAKYPALIGIDQEGGIVARLREGFTESPGAMALSTGKNGEVLAEKVSQMLGAEMHALGINWTYAPVLDISYNADNPTVATRSFGSDKEIVSEMGAAAVRGFKKGKVAACAKHFPGLGNTEIDTHLELATLDTPVERLLSEDMLPYRVAINAGLPTIMTTHTIFSALDQEHPATLSPVVIQRLLREELGFDGVVTTDCMEMKAISKHYQARESAVLAALAGIDIMLFSHTRTMQEDAYDALLEAAKSGRLPIETIDGANRRVATLKAAYGITQPPDVSQIRTDENLALAQEAARAGTVLLRDDYGLPLKDKFTLIEFISLMDSEVVERGGMAGLAKIVAARFPDADIALLKSIDNKPEAMERAEALVKTTDTLVLVTRNAHFNEEQLEMATKFAKLAAKVVLVCARNPYDAKLFAEAATILCTCGDSTPSLQAAADALAGDFVPTGRLPVSL